MVALARLARLLAVRAAQLDAARREERALCARILHFNQPCVEVNFRRQCGDGDKRGAANAEDGRDLYFCQIKKDIQCDCWSL